MNSNAGRRRRRRPRPRGSARSLAATSDDLIVHELCHVWQSQHRMVRMALSYLWQGYQDNRHEVEARYAAAATRDPG